MEIKNLNGKWPLSQAGEAETIPATVPGCVYTDLLATQPMDVIVSLDKALSSDAFAERLVSKSLVDTYQ